MPVDITAITALDVHTHVHRSVRAGQDQAGSGNRAMGEYFGIGSMPHYTVPELADYYRQRTMACVTFTIDSISRTGDEPVPDNIELAELAPRRGVEGGSPPLGLTLPLSAWS